MLTTPKPRLTRLAVLSSCLVLLASLAAAGAAEAYPRPGRTVRISTTRDGAQAAGPKKSALYDFCCSSAISANRRFVAFSSRATNLVPGDGNLASDVFVKDLHDGSIERISISSEGDEGLGFCTGLGKDPNDPVGETRHLKTAQGSGTPSISGNGRYVAFISCASNLVEADRNATADIFVHDRWTGRVRRVSVSSSGEETPPEVSIPGRESVSMNDAPQISDDGRFVAFTSYAPNLVRGDTNEAEDVFVHGLLSRKTERVSVSSDGGEGVKDGFSYAGLVPDLSADGRYVAFASALQGLVTNDGNHSEDAFVHDRRTNRTSRVSVSTDGNEADITAFPGQPGMLGSVFLSRDGRSVLFSHLAANLVPDDRNRGYDAFVHDLETGRTSRVSVDSDGQEFRVPQVTHPQSYVWNVPISMSEDGRYMVFVSYLWYEKLVAGPFEPNNFEFYDHYIHDAQTGETQLLSDESRPARSEVGDTVDGRFIVFNSDEKGFVGGDTNGIDDVFLHDRGEDVGSFVVHNARVEDPGDQPVPSSSSLLAARLIERSDGHELFGVVELDRLASLFLRLRGESVALDAGATYAVRFRIGTHHYEVRVATGQLDRGEAGSSFGLFECGKGIGTTCRKVADLEGGYGTTGSSFTFTVPFDLVRLDTLATVRDVEAVGGLGTTQTGVIGG